jgi:hypothetical protein
MSQPVDSQSTDTSNDPRKIGKLSRSYAQNRSLGMMAFLVIFLVLFVSVGGSSYFGGMAYHYGQSGLLYVCMAILIVALAATVFFSVPPWGNKLIEWITERLYAGEGNAQLSCPMSGSRKLVGWCLAATFFVCIQVMVVLGFLDVYPEKYMQPVSAIYMVPFLVALWLLQRPALGPIVLLWPGLYALHAILILVGIPILFTGRWDSLNMIIPTIGYGLLTGIISHVYSRFVLRKLRRIAREGFQNEVAEDGPS